MSDRNDLIVIYSLTVGLVLFEAFKSGLKFTVMHKHIEEDGIKYTHVSNTLLLGVNTHHIFLKVGVFDKASGKLLPYTHASRTKPLLAQRE